MNPVSSPSVEVSFDVPATMRDGVVLRADVYAPSDTADRGLPTLLLRTPYGKQTVLETAWTGVDPVAAARAGFLVVVQDCRGRFASDGTWEPLRHEGPDGVDSIAWAAGLPRSNGRVGLFGGSYSGSTQWQPAVAGAPALAAMAPVMTWADPRDGLYARGGALELGLDLAWSLVTGIDDVVRRHGDDADLGPRVEAVLDEFDALREHGFQVPSPGHGAVLERHGIVDIGSLAAAAGGRASPDPADVAGAQHRAGVPTLHTGGWYDIFLQGTLDNHRAMVDAGHESHLVVGPWTHENFGNVVGEVDFGIRATRDSPHIFPEAGSWAGGMLAWLGHHVGGDPTSAAPELPPVRVFVMGVDEWRTETEWPPSDATDAALFLHPDGLSTAAPGAGDPPASCTYDLADPVPTTGGNTFITPAVAAGPVDQRAVEARPDVLTFTSEVLAEDVEVAGRVLAHVCVASTATAADWVVRLCDVHPDGRSINVCDGVVRVPDARTPDTHTVDLWSTSTVFRAGHRIRVHVTTSSFPRWDRGPDPDAGPQVASVYLDLENPSSIVLPIRAGGAALGGT